MFKLYHLLVLIFPVSLCAHAQSIQGTWKGRENADGDSCYFELSMQVQDKVVTGETFLLFADDKFQRFHITGNFNPADSTLTFKETKVVDSKHGFLNVNCFGDYSLHIKKTDTAYILTGISMNYTRFPKMLCARGIVNLSKPFDKEEKNTITSEPNELPGKDTAQAYTKRFTQAKTTIISETDTVHIQLYDNGEIDNDTVSLYFNNKELIYKKRLSSQPISFDIILDKKNPLNKLLFVAENLGDIPPNTGLMIITIKDKRYDLNLSADYYTNSSVEFILKE